MTERARRWVGAVEERGWCGVARGKKVRKRRRLCVVNISTPIQRKLGFSHIHEPKARPLHPYLRDTKQARETLKAADLSATC